MVPLRNSIGVNSTSGIVMAGDSSKINNTTGIVTSAGISTCGLLDLVPGRKNDTELVVVWSIEEQSKLKEGLAKYAGEPSITRYINIAAMLPEKTVRDVALRCRWMTKKENGKRRKLEEHCLGKKMKDRKENQVVSASKASVPPAPPLNLAPYSLMMHHMDHNDRLSFDEIGDTTRQLLDENAQVFYSIAANLATLKIQDNVKLLCRTRNNITAILNNMRNMPGIMSQMPPLPVLINEELANAILSNTAQAMMFG